MLSVGCPRYVPAPSEETVSPCAVRKCPSAAISLNFCAYRAVPSGVAPWLIVIPPLPRLSLYLLNSLVSSFGGASKREQARKIRRPGQSFSRKKISPSRGLL